MNEQNNLFSWVKTHQELADFLLGEENNQSGLIELLKKQGITALNDQEAEGKQVELTEIDPFTFFCYIYKHGPEKRLKILQDIAQELKLSIPMDEIGIPSANAQKVWLFPYSFNRKNNEIKRLWNFFRSAINNTITDEQFDDILNIKNTGKVKLTEALFYVDPIHYLPINGPIKPYLKEVLSIDPEFNSYEDYKNILSQVKAKTDQAFYEISYEAWLDKSKNCNYWIFQCNPDMFDLVSALDEDLLDTWTVTAHKDKIKEGDKVIIWMTGDNAGSYALAEVTSEPHNRSSSTDDQLWKKEDQSELKADINITHNLVASPVLKDAIDSIDEHIDLKAGNQGTNFIATKEQYETILDIIESSQSNVYSKIKNAFDQEKLESFLKMIRSFVKFNDIRYDDERISFNVRKSKHRLVFIIGFRYAASISKIQGKTLLSFISQKIIKEKYSEFVNKSRQAEAYWNRVEKYEGYEDIINEGFLTELNRNYKCPY
ncbi:MAG: EVE domain-containing protein [Saprospiraceae bacterium]|nr:EVE domain-containing protein [Saprospiraceae bacterium]